MKKTIEYLMLLINTVTDNNSTKNILLYVLIFLTGLTIIKSFHDVLRFNGVDLRPKITGARGIVQGLDPYNINWNSSMSEKILDPKEGHPPGPSRSTYSPSLLTFFIPFSFLPYKIIRIIWWMIEWSLMFFSIGILNSKIKLKKNRFYFLSISLFFFCSSYMWRLHLERGQYYILLVFLISIIIYYLDDWKKYSLRIGLLIGLLISFRITYIPIILFLLIYKKVKIGLISGITLIFIIFFTSIIGNNNIWKSYFNNINEWEEIIVDPANRINHEWKKEYPTHAENLNLRKFLARKSFNEVIWFRLKNDFGIDYDYYINKVIILILIFTSSVFIYFTSDKSDIYLKFFIMFSVVSLFAFFGPQRHLYTNVIFLPLIALFYNLDFRNIHLFGLLFSLAIGHTLIPVNTPLIPTWGKHIFFFITIVSLIYYELKSKKKLIISKK